MTDKAESWNTLCSRSVRKEKAEIEKRYGIRFGQTEIYCAQCGVTVANPLNHTCKAILRVKKTVSGKYGVLSEIVACE